MISVPVGSNGIGQVVANEIYALDEQQKCGTFPMPTNAGPNPFIDDGIMNVWFPRAPIQCNLQSPRIWRCRSSLMDDFFRLLVKLVQVFHCGSIFEHFPNLDSCGNELEYMSVIL